MENSGQDTLSSERSAAPELIAAVYDDMRRLAAAYLSAEGSQPGMQRTSLVHELYIRLAKRRELGASTRHELLGVAAHLMRRILVDRARARKRLKRQPREAGEAELVFPGRSVDYLSLDEALSELDTLDPRQARIVELRFFGEATIEETAEALAISPRTVKREWATARAWLHAKLAGKEI